MSDIKIAFINPTRPYIVFYHEKDGLCGYIDTGFLCSGVKPVDKEQENYLKHKEELERERAWLSVCLKPLWEKWDNDFLRVRRKGCIAYGNQVQEWIVSTPIEKMIVPEHCSEELVEAVRKLKAQTVYSRYTGGDGGKIFPFERLSEEAKGLYDLGKELYENGKNICIIRDILTNDFREKNIVEKHLCEVCPSKEYIRQIDAYKMRKLLYVDKDDIRKGDWIAFVLRNPTREQVQKAIDWMNGKPYHYMHNHSVLYTTVMGVSENRDGSFQYNVMFFSDMCCTLEQQYPAGGEEYTKRSKQCLHTGEFPVGRFPIVSEEERKQVVEDWLALVGDDGYCFTKHEKSVSVHGRIGMLWLGGAQVGVEWPYIMGDGRLRSEPNTQYYAYGQAHFLGRQAGEREWYLSL